MWVVTMRCRPYRGCKRRSDYWTRSDTVACLYYAALLALK